MQVRVTFDATRPETHLVRVTQVMPATDDAERTFRMAAWIPGSYKMYDLGRHVQDFSARVGGKDARWRQDGKDAWRVEGTSGREVRLVFDVYCRELGVRSSHVTSDHAFLFPITLVLYDGASRPLPHKVEVARPKGWSLFSGLEARIGSGRLAAADDYDHLADCPIEAGPRDGYRVETFSLRRREHRLVVWKPPAGVDWPRVVRDVRAICEATCKVWGGAPYGHYTFFVHTALEGGGGLEHRNSCVLGADPLHLQHPEARARRFYPLVAHEFFHAWNVKRVLPAAFTPYALQEECYTDLLWLFEGVTTYYELPILARAGILPRGDWNAVVTEFLSYYGMAEGRKRRSLAEASRLAWSLLYQPHEHNVNRNVSYYTKGLWVGLCIDAALRERGVTEGLDVVMRHLWRTHGLTGLGVAEDGFAAAVEDATGQDLGRRIKAWTEGVGELPIEKSLRTLGLRIERDWKDPKSRLGLRVHFEDDCKTVARIPDEAPAYRVLEAGDEFVAVEGYRWSVERFAKVAATRKDGETVPIALFRDGVLRTVDAPLTTKPKDKLKLSLLEGDAVATRRRRAWLGQDLPE